MPINIAKYILLGVAALSLLLFSTMSFAHGVDDTTRQFLLNNVGVHIMPFIYIGAKHMVTGYDHLLFLVGVLFLFKPFKGCFALCQHVYHRAQLNLNDRCTSEYSS